MEINVNGSPRVFESQPENLRDLLGLLGLNPELNGIAVALNLSVVPRSKWMDTLVKSGDEIEVITARQGG